MSFAHPAIYTTLDGGSNVDDTLAMNAALAGGGVVRGRPGETYQISAPLVIPSHTTLDMTGCTVQLIAGSNCNMVRNAAWNAGSGRDENITIIGGTWDRQDNAGANNDLHSIVIVGCDGLVIRDASHIITAGKYAIQVADVTGFTIENHDFDVSSDGVHVTGPASNGIIRNLRGSTGDDTLALGCSDYSTYDVSRGDITHISVGNVNATSVHNLVKLFTTGHAGVTTGYVLRDVFIRDVQGVAGENAVTITDDVVASGAGANTITIDGVSALVGLGYELVRLGSVNTVRAIKVRNVTIPAGSPTATAAVRIRQPASSVLIDGIESLSTATNRLVSIEAATDFVRLCNAHDLASVSGSRSVVVSAALGTLHITGMRNSGAGNGVYISGSGSVAQMNLTDITWQSTNEFLILQAATTPNIKYANLSSTAGGVLISNQNASAGVVITGAGMQQASSLSIYRTSTQTMHVFALDFRCEVDRITKVAGGMAYNTKGSLSCGVGPVICDGTNWKNLYTGATY